MPSASFLNPSPVIAFILSPSFPPLFRPSCPSFTRHPSHRRPFRRPRAPLPPSACTSTPEPAAPIPELNSVDTPWWTEVGPSRPDIIVGAEPSPYSFPRIFLENAGFPLLAVIVGTSGMRGAASTLMRVVGPIGVDGLLQGVFMPAIGILFAMMASTAVVTLRQRQQDCRELLHMELSVIRLLASIILDAEIAHLLQEYTRVMDAETFSHRANGIVYHQHGLLSDQESEARERLFAYADDIMFEMMRTVNRMRLRGEVEVEMRELVKLRSRRRATLDTGFPLQYFLIVFALGASIVLSFLLLLCGNPPWIDCTYLPSSRVRFVNTVLREHILDVTGKL